MPDIKTAMEKALSVTLNEWAQDDKTVNQKEKTMSNPTPVVNLAKSPNGKMNFAPTTGVTRAVFDHVKNNSGAPRQQLVDEIVAKGFKQSSVSSLLTQNLRAGIFKQDGHGRVFCMEQAYKSVPTTAQRRLLPPAKKLKASPPPPKTEGIAALKVGTAFDPKAHLDTLSVMQARALYDELKKIFGA